MVLNLKHPSILNDSNALKMLRFDVGCYCNVDCIQLKMSIKQKSIKQNLFEKLVKRSTRRGIYHLQRLLEISMAEGF